jgi:SAM-dependent methyltransferase
MIKKFLTHPLMRNREVDDPQTTELRKELIHQKKFLEQIYIDWYGLIQMETSANTGTILEIGSGAGFLNQYIKKIIKTEIFYLSKMDVILDAACMPFMDQSLAAVVMTDVFHHLPNPKWFLHEVVRVLPIGGKVVMIEPWVSDWSRIIYPRFHHEPFNPQMKGWEFPSSGPLSGSNQALPWIVFERDKAIFAAEFPELKIKKIQPMMPFRYLLSGGVSLRSFMPGWSTSFWRLIENLIGKKMNRWAMFVLVAVEKVNKSKQ